MNLALIGGRGAGKSKIGRKLGKRAGQIVFSIDTLISYEAEGRTAAQIVEGEGWAGFRDREHAVLAKAVSMNNVIIDCGGGILVEAGDPERFSERKAKLLKEHCTVVYIQRDMRWLLHKAGLDANRPSLGNDYVRILERRLPWYENVADYVLDMNDLSIADAVQVLAERYCSTASPSA